jgi:predicted GNAT family N-acyltransferase
MTVTVRRVRDDADLRAALAVREEVFVHEQGVTLAEEIDGLDDVFGTVHVLAVTADGEVVGTARVLPGPLHHPEAPEATADDDAAPAGAAAGSPPSGIAPAPEARLAVGSAPLIAPVGVVHVGRVAVRSAGRGLGVGRALMAAVEDVALADHGVRCGEVRSVRVELSAQESAIGFYRALGYEVADHRYLDARIWHRDAHRVVTG